MGSGRSTPNLRVGLVLGAGGLTGFAFHVAALDQLRRRTGWDARTADVVVGTSAGAIVASLLRGGVPVAELADRMLALPSDPSWFDSLRAIAGTASARLPESAKPSSLGLVEYELRQGTEFRTLTLLAGLLPRGRVPTEAVGRTAAVLHADRWPEDPTWLVAIDLDSGKRHVFGRGDEPPPDVASAVEASSAVPGFFRPVEIGGRAYVDGGIRSPTNADLLLEADVDLAVVVSPLSSSRWPMRSPVQTVLRAGPNRRVHGEVARLRRAGIATLLLEPDEWVRRVIGFNNMDVDRLHDVFVAAGSSLGQRLDEESSAEFRRRLQEVAADRVPPREVPLPRPSA